MLDAAFVMGGDLFHVVLALMGFVVGLAVGVRHGFLGAALGAVAGLLIGHLLGIGLAIVDLVIGAARRRRK